MHRALLVAALAVTFVQAPSGNAANGFLQPGDYMAAGNAACTTNFVYDGTGAKAGQVFLGTAAHCVASVGQDVRDLGGTVWGDVAVIGNAGSTAPDWALIQVRAEHVGRVRAFVKGWPAYPTGFTTPAETAVGDLVQASGYGTGYDFSTPTQEQRRAVLTYDDTTVHDVLGPIHFGDSGGPLVHIATGQALGIVSRLCTGACSETGPTVQGILDQAAAKGFTVTLRTV